MDKTIVATNWSSSGSAKNREVKESISRVGEIVKLRFIDRDTKEFMNVVMDVNGASVIADSLAKICKVNTNSSADWDAVETDITYKNHPDTGKIDFYVNGALFTTWPYTGHPHDSLEEFRKVLRAGFLLGRAK